MLSILLGSSLSTLRWFSSTRMCFSQLSAETLPFSEFKNIPGFYFSKALLNPPEYEGFHQLLLKLKPGFPERFGTEVYAGISFPNEVVAEEFERRLRVIVP